MGVTIPASTPSGALSPGDLVADRYRIEETLGQGVMGTVYRVEHVHMHKRFALKVLDRAWVGSTEMLARFEREAIVAGHIADPHVAQATDFGRLADGSCFLVLEYVDGRTLRSALERGAFKPRRAIGIARSIATALQAAHALGIIHRDLKPENIMLVDREGDPDFVKVLDFGLARFELDSTVGSRDAPGALTRQGAIVGTLPYMSPEQVMGKHVDGRIDLYALGIILFEMLTGDCPFRGEPIAVAQQHVASDPPPLPPAILASAGEPTAEVLKRLLAKTPEGRFATAADLVVALDGCLAAIAGGKRAAPPARPEGEAPPSRVKNTVVLPVGLPALRVSPVKPTVKPWLSLVTWSSGFVARLRARRRRGTLRDALVWARTLRSKLPAWTKRRRPAFAKLRTDANRFVAQLRKMLSSPQVRRWWWVIALGAGAVIFFFVALLVLVAGEKPPQVVSPSSSASVPEVSAKPSASVSAVPRPVPKPSASHR
jgi:serine/threonine-protein kinase